MKRKGSAVWQGGLKDGKGTLSTDSGVLTNVPYSFEKRFGEEKTRIGCRRNQQDDQPSL